MRNNAFLHIYINTGRCIPLKNATRLPSVRDAVIDGKKRNDTPRGMME